MIIIGIDPGTTRIGYGVIESLSNSVRCLEYGIFGTVGLEKSQNMLEVERNLLALLKKYKPERAGIEKLFFSNNQKTVMAVSEMRGVLMLTLARSGLDIFEFTPIEIKRSVSSYGKADKSQVHNMVKLLLGVKEDIKPDDAADALAVAICCTHTIIPL